ncbi:class I SAM-dependent methyltransferase [Aquibaculum sediminis]|uniref:class I SAM-dependent methyltransferase n=1 Tax=Aquibaculum sediminis TaxID=3231907 RepID=UPI003452925F
MSSDVLALSEFYRTHTGQVARHLIRRQVRQRWPDVSGCVVLGLGFATPYMRQFRDEADRVLAFMPTRQGVMHWPVEGPFSSTLVEEGMLPLADCSVDRLLLVHAVEHSEALDALLREAWRVLDGEGRLLVVAPNRRGLWARFDRTPFGHGRPYSPSQLSRLLREHLFTPLEAREALYVPPTSWRWLLRTAPAWERLGQRWFPQVAGVNLLEAKKQLYAVRPLAARQRSKRAFVLPMPVGAAPSPARRSTR